MKKTYFLLLALAFATLGFGQTDIVLNGTFDDATNLDFQSASWGVSGGTLNFAADDNTKRVTFGLSESFTAGETYIITFDIVTANGTFLSFGCNEGATDTVIDATSTRNTGTITISYTHADDDRSEFHIIGYNGGGTTSCTIDNVTIIKQPYPIATIDRENITGPTATDNVVGMSSVGLTRGPGLGIGQTGNLTSFLSNKYTIGGTLADAQTSGEYIEWSVSANTAFEIAVAEIDMRLRRNGLGPSNWQLFYSLDGFATPAIDASGVQTLAANANTNFNFTTLGINSVVSGTITFRVYAWGATANDGNFRVFGETAWALSPVVPNPGIRMIGNIIAPVLPGSFESDIISSTTLGIPAEENIDYTDNNLTSGLNLFNSNFLGEFTIRDGGASGTDADTNPTILSEITFAVTNSENIAALAIYDGLSLNPVAEVTTVSPLTTFSGLNISAPDDGVKQFYITATFKTTVTDNDQIQLTVNSAIPTLTGSSLFLEANAGGSATSITGDINRIEVTVSQFQFNQQPTDGNEFELMVPIPTLSAVDVNSNLDIDANFTGMNVTTSASSSLIPETYDMTNGEAILDNVVFTSTEIGVSLLANITGLSGTSNTFNINGPLINIAQQNFDTATGWTYTSSNPPFGDAIAWANNTGHFNEIAILDANPLDNTFFIGDIFGENNLNDSPPNPFAILTFDDIDISSFNNLRIEFDWQVIGYVNNGNDVEYRLVLDGIPNLDWQTVFDGNGDINDDQGRVKIAVPISATSVALQVRLRNSLAIGYSGFDNFRLVSEFSGLIYTADGGWKDNIQPDATTGTLDALVIDGIYSVSGDAQINNYINLAAATTIIPVAQSLTINGALINSGTLELNSTSDTYSSLIVNGTSQGEVTYFRHVNKLAASGAVSGKNDLISAPVTGPNLDFLALRSANLNLPGGNISDGPITTFAYFFGPFDNVTNEYSLYTSANDTDPIEPGIGYRTASIPVDGDDVPSFTGSTFTFTGNVVIEQSPIAINVGSASLFNLIGNPYPSYISLSRFLQANNLEFDPINSGVYGYSGNFTDGFTIWNQAFSDANPGKLIAPGQGFFVASKVGGGSISFPTINAILPQTDIRSFGTGDDFIPGRPGEQNLAHLKLQLSNGEALYNTDLYFNDNASLGMDSGYDSALFENNTPNFAMYSHLVENNIGRDMAVQSVSYSDLDNVTIPLGINAVQGVQATVSILESDIPEGITVILEDNVSNTFTDIQTGDYTFTPTTTLTETGRFYIHLSRGTLGTTENILNGLEIYTTTNPKKIVVKGLLEDKTTFQLYDIQGRLVNTQLLNTNDTTHTIDVSSLAAGIYVVQLQNTTGNRTQKVIIK